MIKRKIDDYIRNYYETNRNALLITGARQIGKTYSIRQFGKMFKSFIEINFVEMPEAVDLFKGAKWRHAAALVRPDLRTAYQGGNARLFRRSTAMSRYCYGN